MTQGTPDTSSQAPAAAQPPVASAPTAQNDYEIFEDSAVGNQPVEAAPAAPAPAPEAAAAPAAPTLSAHQLDLAKSVGFSADDFKDMTAAQADLLISRAAAKRLESVVSDASRPSAAGSASPEAVSPGAASASPADPQFLIPTDDSVVDAGVAKAINEPLTRLLERLAQAEARIHQLEGFEGERLRARGAQTLDIAIAKLNKDSRYGKGPMPSLTDQSARKRRELVVREAMRLAGQNASWSQVAAKIAEADAGLEDIFGAAAASPATGAAPASRSSSKITPEQWERAATEVPTQRPAAPEPKGVDRAKRVFMQKHQEMTAANGAAVSTSSSSDDDV